MQLLNSFIEPIESLQEIYSEKQKARRGNDQGFKDDAQYQHEKSQNYFVLEVILPFLTDFLRDGLLLELCAQITEQKRSEERQKLLHQAVIGRLLRRVSSKEEEEKKMLNVSQNNMDKGGVDQPDNRGEVDQFDSVQVHA